MFTETTPKTINLDRLSRLTGKSAVQGGDDKARAAGRRQIVRRTLMGGLIFAAGLVGGLAFERPGEPLELADRTIDRVVAKLEHKLNERMIRAERSATRVHTKVREQASERRAASGDLFIGVRDAIAGSLEGAGAPEPVSAPPVDPSRLAEKPVEKVDGGHTSGSVRQNPAPIAVESGTQVIYRQPASDEAPVEDEAVEVEMPEDDAEDLSVPAEGEVDEVDDVDEKAMGSDAATVS